jgi:head-tail adaptor
MYKVQSGIYHSAVISPISTTEVDDEGADASWVNETVSWSKVGNNPSRDTVASGARTASKNSRSWVKRSRPLAESQWE